MQCLYFFTECIKHTDCPDGGSNYVCNANKCECPHPKVLDNDDCVGMLLFEKKYFTKIKSVLDEYFISF